MTSDHAEIEAAVKAAVEALDRLVEILRRLTGERDDAAERAARLMREAMERAKG